MIADRRLRRWIGWAIFAAAMAVAGWILPRVLPRSPVTILILCVAAVVTMRLVEHRIRAWFRRLEARRAAALRRPPPRS
jgi:peptidoglycan/LPS O-acetylase OafA/YrhL